VERLGEGGGRGRSATGDLLIGELVRDAGLRTWVEREACVVVVVSKRKE
jgi:hypothetical protein